VRGVRNATLRGQLEAFTTDAAMRLSLAVRDGAEIPFDVVESSERGAALYCYRPLTNDFIRARLGLLAGLPTYAPVVQALEFSSGVDTYLRARGEGRVPDSLREQAEVGLRCFLARVFAERSEFAFDPDRFEPAYAELERCLYGGLGLTEVVTPLTGLALDDTSLELALATGLSIVRQELLEEPPAGLVDGLSSGDLLLVARIAQERSAGPALGEARLRFRQLVTALRLYDPGSFAVGPIGFHRTDGGVWTPVAIGPVPAPAMAMTLPAAQEDELRGFINLIGRRLDSVEGEIRWALARFEFGAERRDPYESLTDYLLGLRALLEPEGTASGRLAQRLSVICAGPDDRAGLAERTARAAALERSVILGQAGERWRGNPTAEVLIEEMADHLRAILRDVLCGHLAADVCTIADELLAEAASETTEV
jgi:hypothetical protein